MNLKSKGKLADSIGLLFYMVFLQNMVLRQLEILILINQVILLTLSLDEEDACIRNQELEERIEKYTN